MIEVVYDWMMIAEEHAKTIADKLARQFDMVHVLIPKLISQEELSDPLPYSVVLVAANYGSRADDEFRVAVGDEISWMLVIPKLKGSEWVPLVMKTHFVHIKGGSWIRIDPMPDKLFVIQVMPNGYLIKLEGD